MKRSVKRAIRKLLHGSFAPIDYKFDNLTEQERAAVGNANTFRKLVNWLGKPERDALVAKMEAEADAAALVITHGERDPACSCRRTADGAGIYPTGACIVHGKHHGGGMAGHDEGV